MLSPLNNVVIIGGGSSIREGVKKGLWDKISGLEIWSLNFAFRFMPYLPTREIWADTSFYRNNLFHLENLYQQGVQLETKNFTIYDQVGYITSHKAAKDLRTANEHPEYVFNGRMGLVGVFALDLACKRAYRNIYLLGYDFGTTSYTDRDTHFYKEKVKEYDITSGGVDNPSVYRKANNELKDGVEDWNFFSKYSSNIVNVSMKSNIKAFEKITYDEFFTRIQNAV